MHAKVTTFALTTAALLLTGSLFAQQKHQTATTTQSMQNSADRTFMSSAAEANLAEIDTAKMVAQEVRKFLRFNRMLRKSGNGQLEIQK